MQHLLKHIKIQLNGHIKMHQGIFLWQDIINNGYAIDVDFREGNEAPASKNLEFIKQCELQLPLGVKFDRFRADSASYQAYF